MSKAQLRREMSARREALGAEKLARLAVALTENVASLAQFRAARSVLATIAIGSEWSTQAFIARARSEGKIIVLPRVTAPPRHLELHAVSDLVHDLVPGVWNIPEPDPALCPAIGLDTVDFALVPALAADREGFRLGYGAGYFDKLLAGRSAARPYCVTALPSVLVLERLPHEPHDVAVDLVLDERGPVAADSRSRP